MAMEYSSWWPAPSWISPGAALFLLCNVLVGAIVLTSSRGDEAGGRPAASTTRRLCGSASSMVLGRLRSFSSMFSVHPDPVLVEDGYDTYMELEAEVQQPHQPAAAEPAIPTAPANTVVVAAASEITAAYAAAASKSAEEVQEPACQGHAQQRPSSSSSPVAAAEATVAAERPATVVGSMVQRARACRREFVEEALEGKAALNARAEVFIRQFREDLKLQRLNSIINYTRALRRGAGGAAPAAGE